MFFIVGIIFLTLGITKTLDEGLYQSYELLLLGAMLFIPGSYHTFIAVQAFRKVPGYTYEEVTVMEGEAYFYDD